tara:strand:+ start:5509 stop:5763 length:255 start_codon:yes stop_codon:yes gene_type:complete
MEFPIDIKRYIFSYLPCVYKKTLHMRAITADTLFMDLIIDRLTAIELAEELIEGPRNYTWFDSYIQYKKWRSQVYNLNRQFLIE